MPSILTATMMRATRSRSGQGDSLLTPLYETLASVQQIHVDDGNAYSMFHTQLYNGVRCNSPEAHNIAISDTFKFTFSYAMIQCF